MSKSIIVGLALIVAIIAIFSTSTRYFTVPVAAISIALAFSLPFHRKYKLASTVFVLFIILSVAPFDIRFDGIPNQQYKVLEYFSGYPGPDASAVWMEGNSYWSGCMSSGYDPKWVIVL